MLLVQAKNSIQEVASRIHGKACFYHINMQHTFEDHNMSGESQQTYTCNLSVDEIIKPKNSMHYTVNITAGTM